MRTHINGLAPQRMHWVGLLAAILVWVLGVTEVSGNATIWFIKRMKYWRACSTPLLKAHRNCLTRLSRRAA